MKKTVIITLLCAAFLSMETRAQSSSYEFDYQVSFPMGEFSDFVGQPGWLGFSGQWMKYLKNDRLSIGGNLSYFYFSDNQGKKTVEAANNTTYTGTVVNFTNIYGLMAILQYDLKPKKDALVPFVRIGAGTNYQDQRKDIGLYEFKTDGFQFMGNAEAGIRFNTGSYMNWVVAATYHFMPSSEMVSTSFLGIKLGIHGFTY